MRTFRCHCGNTLFFENTRCLSCGRELGYLPEQGLLSALEPLGNEAWLALSGDLFRQHYRKCANYVHEGVCNWMIPVETSHNWCPACRLNQTIPNLAEPNARLYWSRLEMAKRRLLYTLIQLGLPITPKLDDPEHGLAFAFLADSDSGLLNGSYPERIATGHHDGVITINLAEADDAHRETIRQQMMEPYRTLLGHFRHESGHYFWEQLLQGPSRSRFRELFGDERTPYPEALQRYYAKGAPPDWQSRYISAYASSHPWEDWAESWAHYLLIQDTLESAADAGIARFEGLNFAQRIQEWSTTSTVINALNRSMGLNDAWPFVLSPAAVEKLAFVESVIRRPATVAN